MKRLLNATVWATIVSCLSVAAAGTLFTIPHIVVWPRSVDFGAVPWKGAVTNTFVVENWGGGKLDGKATVPPPFKILSGESYRLGPSDVQVVTISYSPSGAAVDTNVVSFTGAQGAIVPVVGKLSGLPPGKER